MVAFYIIVMSCGIYKWTSPSGKSYIGQSVNLECRKQDFINRQLYTSRNEFSLTVIDKARKKYPDFEQWTYEILECCEPNELNDREQYYIKLFGTFKNGYNETSGGGHNTEISDETRKKIGKASTGRTPWNKGKTLSDETKEKNRQAHLGKTLSDEHKEKIGKGNKGRIVSEETKEKISKAKAKQVDQYSLDGVFIQSFVSLKNIEKQLGYSSGNISNCCKGKRKSAYGFIWRYHN